MENEKIIIIVSTLMGLTVFAATVAAAWVPTFMLLK